MEYFNKKVCNYIKQDKNAGREINDCEYINVNWLKNVLIVVVVDVEIN